MMTIGGAWWLYQTWRGWRIVIFVTAFAAAAAYMSWFDDNNRSVWSAEAATEWQGQLHGRIVSPLTVDGNRVQLLLKSDTWQHKNGDQSFVTDGEKVVIRLFLKEEAELEQIATLSRGDKVALRVTLEQPQAARNPGGFDYRQYLYRQHVHWLGTVHSVDDVTLISSSNHWLKPLDYVRDYLAQRVGTIYDEPQAGLIRGMILGERQAVDLQVERQFATLGLLHLLAISGLHVGVILALSYGGLTWLGLTRERAAMIAMMFLPLYALLTGAAAPVIRASLVGGLVLLAVLLRQWKDSLHFLALAAAVMLVWNPYWLFTASFQLSFIISAGIILGVPTLSVRIAKGPLFLRQTLAVTFVAQLCSFPLIIYYFNEFSLLSGLANLVVVPAVSVFVIPLSFITVILAAIAVPLAFLPAKLNALVIDGVLFVSDMLVKWEPLHLVWATPSLYWVYVYYVLLGLLYVWWLKYPINSVRLWPRVSLLILFAAIVFIAYYPYPWWNRSLAVTFLDVGQGDAIVVETPQRQTLVIDAGGKLFFEEEPWQVRRDPFDVGKDVVVPFLRHKGIRHVDYLFMSHGDADHIGGMQAIVENVPVHTFIRGPDTVEPSVVEQELLLSLKERQVPLYRGESGTGWEIEPGLTIQFLQPDIEKVAASDRNAQSLVLRLVYQGRSIILPGDADEAVERQIIEDWDIPPVDVLKAGHHGSGSSTGEAWLQAIRPRVTVLSLGENNRYNHPHPDVLDRLEQVGSTIYRTDRQGGIVVQIDHKGTLTVVPTIEPIIDG